MLTFYQIFGMIIHVLKKIARLAELADAAAVQVAVQVTE